MEVEEVESGKQRMAPSAVIVHEAIRLEGEHELERAPSALAWSGLAAGLSMGFSLIAQGLLQTALPDAPWRLLIVKFGYSIGFLVVVLGRQQLFTENTLTPVLPWLLRPDMKTTVRLLRLWGIVLATNILGAGILAYVMASTTIFEPDVHGAFYELGMEAFQGSFLQTLGRAIFAGWLIALMVWLLPFAETWRVAIIILLSYLIGIAHFDHVVAGSVEVLYVVAVGQLTLGDFLVRFFLPTLIGNMIGGIALVAFLNHAQAVAKKK